MVGICACFSLKGETQMDGMMNIHILLPLLTIPASPESYMIINQERCVWFIY